MLNTIKARNITWVDIKEPNEKDLQWLKDNFSLHPLVLKELPPPT